MHEELKQIRNYLKYGQRHKVEKLINEARLSNLQQIILRQHFLQNMSLIAIALANFVSVDTIKKNLTKAYKACIKELQHE